MREASFDAQHVELVRAKQNRERIMLTLSRSIKESSLDSYWHMAYHSQSHCSISMISSVCVVTMSSHIAMSSG